MITLSPDEMRLIIFLAADRLKEGISDDLLGEAHGSLKHRQKVAILLKDLESRIVEWAEVNATLNCDAPPVDRK